MKLISVEKMKQLESAANGGGYGYEKMMLKAGTNLAQVVHKKYFASYSNVLGLVGGGNNGGDTLIALTELQKSGWTCSAFLIKEDLDLKPLVIKLQESGGKVVDLKVLDQEIEQADVILDGIFGTGFTPPVREPVSGLLKHIGALTEEKTVVAVDCPSGVDCTTGEVSPGTLKAKMTVSMEAIKEGMLKLPAFEYCGQLVTVELGIPKKFTKPFEDNLAVIDPEMVCDSLPVRPLDSHKGTFGHLIVCGGSVNYPGAPMMAARSAYHSGAGLVECAIPERIYEAVVAGNSQSIFTILEDEDGVISENAAATLASKLNDADCLLLGPGIGTEDTTFRFVQRLLFVANGKKQSSGVGFVPSAADKRVEAASKLPNLVIDADALRMLARVDGWEKKLTAAAVLTPHPGEMAALTGLPVVEIQKDRRNIASDYAKKWQQVVVLKGAFTVIASPDGRIALLPYANSALAKAGTGDVLAGVIAGLLTQGTKPFEAALAGVWLHAEAAVIWPEHRFNAYGLVADDIIDWIPYAFMDLPEK